MTMVNQPVTFPGTKEEAAANRASHHWYNWDGEILCSECEHKVWHVGANYPCGVEPPRELVDR